MKNLKILLTVLLVACLATAFFGCSKASDDAESNKNNTESISEAAENNDSEDEEDIVQVNDDGSKSITYANPTVIDESSYYLNGEKIELPITYKEFKKVTGYEYDAQSLAQDKIEPGRYYLTLYLTSSDIEGKDLGVGIPAINYTDKNAPVEDLSVIGITVYGTESIDFKLESGLTIAQEATVDDIINMYGTPESSTIEADGVNGAVEYHFSTDTAYQALTIHIKEGKVYEISLTIPFEQ